MADAKSRDAYSDPYTKECERVLVTLLSGIGPWRDSIVLVGGLTPRYLVKARPPEVPQHAGTGDVDVVIDLAILADTKAYKSLEENLRKLGFEPVEKGQKSAWRWQTKTESGATMILEFLADNPEEGKRIRELPTEGNISACNIPHSSIVFDLFETTEIKAELLNGGGVSIQAVRHANLVSFTVLKIFSFRGRGEPKDAHDLVYCIQHAPAGRDAVVAQFKGQLEGKHGDVLKEALAELAKAFADEQGLEGYQKDGPTKVASFEIAPGDETREMRLLRQREVADMISTLLANINQTKPAG